MKKLMLFCITFLMLQTLPMTRRRTQRPLPVTMQEPGSETPLPDQEESPTRCDHCLDWSANCLAEGTGEWLTLGYLPYLGRLPREIHNLDFLRDNASVHATYFGVPLCCLTLATYLKKHVRRQTKENKSCVTHCSELCGKSISSALRSAVICPIVWMSVGDGNLKIWG